MPTIERFPPIRRAVPLAVTVAALMALAGGGPAAAQTTALTGIWLLDQHTYDNQENFRPPLNPEALAIAEKQRHERENNGAVLSDNGKMCLPIGMPGMVTNEFALQFLETPGLVTVVSENSPLVRSISLTKTSHTTEQPPTWNGNSIGHWEGQTLVVDTVNLNDRVSHFPFGAGGMRSLTTRIIERYHVEDGGKTLINDMTFEDPKVLSRPWTVTYKYYRAEAGAELWDYICEVNTEGWSERYAGDPAFKKLQAPPEAK